MERVKGIEPSLRGEWFRVAICGRKRSIFAVECSKFTAQTALRVMASIYRKKNSPYWFIQFIDGDGKRRNKSTEFRASDPGETMKARTLRAQMEAKELSRTGTVGPQGGNWDAWVPQFLDRHCDNPRTRERYADGWKWIALWLQVRKLHSPRDITYRTRSNTSTGERPTKRKAGRPLDGTPPSSSSRRCL